VNVTIDWLHLVLLLGAAQGFLLAGVLAAHRSNRTANRLLATLIATFTIYLLGEVYYSTGLIRTYPHLFGISYPLPWVFGPLTYLYALAASDRTWRISARDWLHFLPPVVVVIAGANNYLMSGPDKIALYDRLQVGDVPTAIRVFEPTKYVSGFAYSVATFAYLRRHRRRIENSYSNTERVNLLWLLWLSGVALTIWVVAVSGTAAGLVPEALRKRSDDLVSVGIALLVYAIGYTGLRQPEIFRYDSEPTPTSRRSVPPTEAPAAPTAPLSESAQRVASVDAPASRYERSGLGDAEAGALKTALLSLMMEEHPYRDPDLTLPNLAERLGTTPHKLSEVLNTEIGQTFYDFINRYRVDDVRRRLAESRSKDLNVLTVAMDAGFASKSTFNQVFKKQTGQTPSTYRKALAG
jgi:AraC-like DNA-binding protein